jgi:hypothetical protein
MSDFLGLGVAPWVVITAVTTWIGQTGINALKFRVEQRDAELDHDVKLEMHRDELTFALLTNARSEMAAARIEISELRSEVSQLRGLEQHMYHFEQSLEHIEAMLVAKNDDERKASERAARAFLNRMKRGAEARGTIANELQRVDSAIAVAERKLKDDPK